MRPIPGPREDLRPQRGVPSPRGPARGPCGCPLRGRRGRGRGRPLLHIFARREISVRCPMFEFVVFFFKVSKFSRNLLEQNRFCSSFGRSGAESRATRCRNSSLLRCLATAKTSKKRFGKNLILWDRRNQFFAIFPGFLELGYSLPFNISRKWRAPPP